MLKLLTMIAAFVVAFAIRHCHSDGVDRGVEVKPPIEGVEVLIECVDVHANPPSVVFKVVNHEKYPIEFRTSRQLLPLAESIKVNSQSDRWDLFEWEPGWRITSPSPDMDTIIVQANGSMVVDMGLLGRKRKYVLTPQEARDAKINVEIHGTIKYRLIGGGGEKTQPVDTRSVAKTRCD